MEYDINEDNECPFCGADGFFEYILISPDMKDSKYEYSCNACGKEKDIKLGETPK